MKPRVEVVGHRGYPARYPDNTLAGLIASAPSVDLVETDVRRSGDGKLVLSHDPRLGRLEVATRPWSELAEVDLGGGHRPALLDEALAALPDTGFQLEVKNLPFEPGFEPDHRLALETAERARPGDMVTSFNPETLAAVGDVFPGVVTGLCLAAGGDVVEAIRMCAGGGHRVLVPSAAYPVGELARAVEARLAVYPWVVDDAEQVRELVAIGVSGIITDDPPRVRATLDQSK